MNDAFERLTFVQQHNINKDMFSVAYECIVFAKDDDSKLFYIVQKKSQKNPDIAADLLRYCKLVKTVI